MNRFVSSSKPVAEIKLMLIEILNREQTKIPE